MNLKLVSKNNMGIVATLILVILLSQSRFFDFLINTHLGRIILLTIIILIAYTNKILGLLGVLFIIIAFNQNDGNIVRSYNFYEGFDGLTSVSDNNTTDNKTIADVKKAKAVTNAVSTQNSTDSTQTDSTQTDSTQTDSTQTDSTSSNKILNNAREGFCMSDRELNMLRGKQSNSVPVYNKMRQQSDGVDPTDTNVFTNLYTSF